MNSEYQLIGCTTVLTDPTLTDFRVFCQQFKSCQNIVTLERSHSSRWCFSSLSMELRSARGLRTLPTFENKVKTLGTREGLYIPWKDIIKNLKNRSHKHSSPSLSYLAPHFLNLFRFVFIAPTPLYPAACISRPTRLEVFMETWSFLADYKLM